MTNQEFIESIKMDGEEWKDVVGYKDLYMISSYGRVASLAKYVNNRFKDVYKEPRLMKSYTDYRNGKKCSPFVNLSKDKKDTKFRMPTLVANHFIPNPDNRTFLRFKDGNNQNCKASNLEWGIVKDRRKQYDTSSLEGEEWMDIPGYERLYRAFTMGRVYSYRMRKILVSCRTGREMKDGYYQAVTLVDRNGNKKRISIHRIVASCFIPNPDNHPCVDHINTIPYDNRVENLKWCTYSENNLNPITNMKMRKAHRSNKGKSKYRKVVQLKNNQFVREYSSIQETTKKGFSVYSVSSCCSKRQKSHKGYQFVYLSDYENLTNMSKNSTSSVEDD